MEPTPLRATDQQKNEELLDGIPAIVWEADPESLAFTFVSSHAQRLLGYSAQDWLTPGFWEGLIYPADRERVMTARRQATAEKRAYTDEYRLITARAATVWVHETVTVVTEGDVATKLSGVIIDVSQQKQAEETLRESDAFHRMLIENVSDFIRLHEVTGRSVYASPSVASLYAKTPAYLFEFAAYPEDAEGGRRWWDSILNEGKDIFVWRVSDRDGGIRWLETRGSIVHYHGKPHILTVCRDITARKDAERTAMESRDLLNAIVEGTSDPIFVKDLEGRYLLINAAGAQTYGKPRDQIVGTRDDRLFPPGVAQAIVQRDSDIVASGKPQTFEETITVGGGSRTFVTTKSVFRNGTGEAIGLVGISSDVTKLNEMEEQFRQAQKMEAVGRLAGGVAHDFNNLLTVINASSVILLESTGQNDPNRELLTEIREAGDRAAVLTRQLLAFSRKQVLQPRVVDLNDLLDRLLKLLRRLIGEDVETLLARGDARALTEIDPGQFEQAIINLAVNARDAMPQGGRLTIETCNTDLSAEHAELFPEVQAGPYVMVSVADSGHGMSEAIKDRIFEPFFTTKAMGEGTGLGLAMVYGFIKQSGGHIEVSSGVGSGTTFRIYLRRAAEETIAGQLPPQSFERPTGTETVLLVEDEESVRRLANRILQSSGYTVLEAKNGEDAIQIAHEYQGIIDILVTDLVMPRMSGTLLARMITDVKPDVRVLLMSGYSEQAVLSQDMPDSKVAFLHKPFTPSDLARKVREVLDTPRPHRASS